MHARTQEALRQLAEVEWFRAVGQRDTDAAIVLSSWAEAIASCVSPEWANLCLEATNRYAEQVAHRSKERFNQWNVITEDVKAVTIPLVERKIARVVKANGLPQVFEDTVQWDIFHLAMESAYADVYPPGFYASQAYWYLQGHFPCGWHSNFPTRTLIIF